MSRPKKPLEELKTERVVFIMGRAELEALDDWMFANRLRSRGEAIRRLVSLGIETGRVKTSAEHAGTVLKLVEG